MNILLISFGDYDYDGRLRELYQVSKKLGTTFLISRGNQKEDNNHFLINDSYLRFCKKAVDIGKKLSGIDALFLDNRKSIIPGLKLKNFFKTSKLILDCRELYLSKYVHHLSGKIGCYFEKKAIKRADVIICANEERASFMQDYYKLKKRPLVFENYRFLKYSSQANKEQSLKKFKRFDISDEIRIISTAGCDTSRLTDVLVKNLKLVNHNCRLFLVGGSSEKDKTTIEMICKENGIDNVEIVGRLKQDDLKALISICHIGIVSYHQKDINNKFCASGKIYEFACEELPVVTTTNPPLRRIVDSFLIGAHDDLFYNGIESVVSNYAFYKNKTIEYKQIVMSLTHNAFIRELGNQIIK